MYMAFCDQHLAPGVRMETLRKEWIITNWAPSAAETVLHNWKNSHTVG